MFGYRNEARLAGQLHERWEAQKTWPFLTDNALMSLATSDDLLTLVRMSKGKAMHARPDDLQAATF